MNHPSWLFFYFNVAGSQNRILWEHRNCKNGKNGKRRDFGLAFSKNSVLKEPLGSPGRLLSIRKPAHVETHFCSALLNSSGLISTRVKLKFQIWLTFPLRKKKGSDSSYQWNASRPKSSFPNVCWSAQGIWHFHLFLYFFRCREEMKMIMDVIKM